MKALERALLAALFLCACSPALAQAVAAATQPFAEIAIYPEREAFATVLSLNQRESEARAAAADVRANEAALTSARRSLGKTVVRAPFRAIVRERLANVGEIASPGTQLLRVLDASRIEVSAQVQSEDAAELPHVKQITFVDQAGVQYPLRLVRVVLLWTRASAARRRGCALPAKPRCRAARAACCGRPGGRTCPRPSSSAATGSSACSSPRAARPASCPCPKRRKGVPRRSVCPRRLGS